MSVLISYKYNFIFIHVYKVAGSSIEHVLEKYTFRPYESVTAKVLQKLSLLPRSSDFDIHITAKDLRNKLGSNRFNRFFKFAFVRNPWDWQVSLYTYMLKNEKHPQHSLIKSMSSFEEYIEWRVNTDKHLQKEFVTDETGNIMVDFVGKYENLQSDFNKICVRLAISESLPHLNVSKVRDYREYYTDKTKNLIFEHFKDDLELFSYSWPE